MTTPPQHGLLLRAWRQRLLAFRDDGVALDVMRPADAAARRHCGELLVHVHVTTLDGTVVAPRGLGELLRVVALTTAPHVDAAVFNALWDDSEGDNDRGGALCPFGAGLCARCDAIDRRGARPVVQLALQGQYRRRSAVRMLHDALYNWNEAIDGSDEYKQLREAFFRAPALVEEEDVLPLETQLVVQLGALQPPFGAPYFGAAADDAENEVEVRELEALLARHATETADTRHFCITRVEVAGGAAQSASPYLAPLFTTILNAGGVATNLEMALSWAPEGAPDPWQWLFDWAARSARAPVRVHRMAIMYDHNLTVDTLLQLLAFVRDRCGPLDELTLQWPIQDDAVQRRRALQAVGATLFAPSSRVRIQKLVLDLGELTDQDDAALQLGVGDARTGDVGSDALVAGAATTRVQAVKWKLPQTTAEPNVGLIAPLLACAGVRELEINVGGHRSLSCRTLKTVLQRCPSLTKLTWSVLLCDDFAELTDGSWSSDASQPLRALGIVVAHGDAPSVASAVDALLARVGSKLRSFRVYALHRPLGASIADSIIARCPQLQELDVSYADALFFDQLVRAFDEGRCGVCELSVESGPAGPMSLLAALKNPARAVARTLRQLKVGTYRVDDASKEAVTQAFLEALAANSALRRAVFVGDPDAEETAQFEALPRQFVARLPSMRRRLALLSVTHTGNSRLAKLPPDVLAAIFEFAGRRARRYAY